MHLALAYWFTEEECLGYIKLSGYKQIQDRGQHCSSLPNMDFCQHFKTSINPGAGHHHDDGWARGSANPISSAHNCR